MAARTIHLVGSVPLGDAGTVFRSCGSILGNLLKRYPDGETGSGRENWVQWLRPVAEQHPAFELEPAVISPSGAAQRRYFRLKSGARADDLTFAHVGYATYAKTSYDLFRRLRSDGVIPATARFQVSIPTPLAFLNAFITAAERTAVEPSYTKALLAEVAEITAAIPAEDLALQWDAVIEILILEGVRPTWRRSGRPARREPRTFDRRDPGARASRTPSLLRRFRTSAHRAAERHARRSYRCSKSTEKPPASALPVRRGRQPGTTT